MRQMMKMILNCLHLMDFAMIVERNKIMQINALRKEVATTPK